MANQMIALQARAPDMPSFTDYIQIREHAQDRQNAMLKQQQDQNAMLRKQAEADAMNNAYGQALDPATGRIDANKLSSLLAQGGFGSSIPGVQQELSKAQGEQTKTSAAQLEHLMKFSEASRSEFGNAASPEDALGRAQRLAQAFPDMAPHLQAGLADMPKDPAAFAAWKQEVLRKNLTAEQQLKQHFQAQTTGDGVRVLSIPEYGAGPATVVPGSQGSLPPQTQFVWGANGGNIVDTRTGQATPVTAGGGSTGGGHAALATNPGALKDGPFARSQPGYAGAKGSFATFATPEQGIAAQEALIRSRYIGRGLNTVSKIIDTYAPVGPENSPASVANYKAYVARRAGIDPNAPIPPEKVSAVAAAQREFETGNRGGGQLKPAPTAAEKTAQAKATKEALPAYSQSALDAFDRAIGTANRLLEHPGFNAGVGLPSINPLDGNLAGMVVPGSPAADFRAELNALKAQVFLPMVQSMKGMGALSNAEGEKLTAAIGALDANMSESGFRSSLNRVIKDLQAYKQRGMKGGAASPGGNVIRYDAQGNRIK